MRINAFQSSLTNASDLLTFILPTQGEKITNYSKFFQSSEWHAHHFDIQCGQLARKTNTSKAGQVLMPHLEALQPCA